MDEALSNRRRHAEGRLWRSAIGLVAIYAVLLHGFLVGIANASLSTPAGDFDALAAHALCIHAPDDVTPAPDETPQRHSGGMHCPFCLGGGVHGFMAPSPVTPAPVTFVIGTVPPSATAFRDPLSIDNPAASPRGPPLLV